MGNDGLEEVMQSEEASAPCVSLRGVGVTQRQAPWSGPSGYSWLQLRPRGNENVQRG